MSTDHIPYQPIQFTNEDREKQAQAYDEFMNRRRTVRNFSDQPVSRKVIGHLIMTASSAPSGAHKQPWTFCAVSDPDTKKAIRKAAEKEEYDSYHGRMSERWLEDLKPIGTNWEKPFLEEAPWLIVVFKKVYDRIDGTKASNYYVNESVGIACGFLISAIHNAGLVTVTHTPSPMNFLGKILDRPEEERPYLLLPVGLPAKDAMVPNFKRKNLNQVSKWY
ncbi:nitroreductase family protein [Marinoscillum sp. MHG1-6]|uniref:nitroreductase family protein n=1 Tax=Marinoscillum sp. MHG1-6 TaxID=2959627 RepID=UPI0021577385|nr:nitroreductase family protein [Marinoscillum sp. MHG1-6]